MRRSLSSGCFLAAFSIATASWVERPTLTLGRCQQSQGDEFQLVDFLGEAQDEVSKKR